MSHWRDSHLDGPSSATGNSQTEGLNAPAIPAYVLRGHVSTIHALHFFASNAYLASADGDGWLVVWSLASKRAVAVWKAHEGGIQGIKDWGDERLITHGRDHRLRVWQLRREDIGILDVTLPVDRANGAHQQVPWLLHSLPVNALNFCSFAMCYDKSTETQVVADSALGSTRPILIAAPNGLDSGGIDIFQLPSERRVAKISSDNATKTGMVMALALSFNPATERLMVLSGYEDGQTIIHVRRDQPSSSDSVSWETVLLSKPHSQPVLSLDLDPQSGNYFTSSADAVIAKVAIPSSAAGETSNGKPVKTINTKHAGQQGLRVRSDGKIFATAGWDARIRVYSTKTMTELAVLKWHKEGCYATAFARVHVDGPTVSPTDPTPGRDFDNGNALDVIKEERCAKAQRTHWLAGGGKDGKISLWDIY